MKKIALILSLLPLTAMAQDAVTVRVVTPFASGHLLAQTAEQFKIELGKRAPQLKVSVAASVLNEQTINPAMQACDANIRVGEIMLTGGQPIQDYAPAYFFFNGPYVIRDFAHFQKVWNSQIGQKLNAELESKGKLVSFDPVYRGYRQFTSNKPLLTPADARDLKLRLPPVPDWISVWDSVGAKAVQVPLPGIYGALKDKSAEASEGDLTQIQSLKLNEVQSHLTLTNHLVGFGMTMANACFFNKELKPAEQKAVREAMNAAAHWGSQQIVQKEGEILAALEKGGMKIVKPDAAAIRKAAEPAVNELFAKKWTVTSWKDVLAY